MYKMIRYAAMALCTVMLIVFTLNYPYFDIYDIFTCIVISLLAGYVFVATFTYKQTDVRVYAAVYAVLLLFTMFGRHAADTWRIEWPPRSLDEYITSFVNRPDFAVFMLIGNSVMFFPMGIIVGRLRVPRKRQLLCLLGAMIVIIPVLEILQCHFKVGVFDIYDIFSNELSMILGWGYAFLIEKFSKEKTRKRSRK